MTSVDDLATATGGLPPTDGIRLALDGDTRIICRPSGTEPKLKCYLEVVRRGDRLDGVPPAQRADRDAGAIKTDLAAALGL